MNPSKNMDTILIDGFNEIWLRDILGFPVGDHIVKPIYQPTYYKTVYDEEYLTELDKQTDEIINHITEKQPTHMPLIIDGGNLITNGRVAIITNKVIADNKDLSWQEIEQLISSYLGIVPFFIGTSNRDGLGHSDGYVAFLNKEEILLSSYPQKYFLKDEIEYVSKLSEILIEKFVMRRIYDRPVDEKVKSIHNSEEDYLYSAKGNYVNFLRLDNTIILPQYTLTTVKESSYYNDQNIKLLNDLGYNITPLNCNKLSELGGVLRCLSLIL